MKEVINIDSVRDYHDLIGYETVHPLVSVVDLSKADKSLPRGQLISHGLYCGYFKTAEVCTIRYGRNHYDYKDGTLIFLAPGQALSIEDDSKHASVHALLFHPDLLHGTSLAQRMKDYSFFCYEVNEALHVSAAEAEAVFDCFRKIRVESRRALDKHSNKLVVSNIERMLNYFLHFYARQFITRDQVNAGIVEKFEQQVTAYLDSDRLAAEGIPSVAFFAEEAHLSVNYFGNLIKSKTGKTALKYIQARLVDLAKKKMGAGELSINEVAYQLGFQYPQHFTRFFKQQVGATPNQYRNSST